MAHQPTVTIGSGYIQNSNKIHRLSLFFLFHIQTTSTNFISFVRLELVYHLPKWKSLFFSLFFLFDCFSLLLFLSFIVFLFYCFSLSLSYSLYIIDNTTFCLAWAYDRMFLFVSVTFFDKFCYWSCRWRIRCRSHTCFISTHTSYVFSYSKQDVLTNEQHFGQHTHTFLPSLVKNMFPFQFLPQLTSFHYFVFSFSLSLSLSETCLLLAIFSFYSKILFSCFFLRLYLRQFVFVP